MTSNIAPSATKGFADASAYDTHRPSYPPEAVEDLLMKLQVKGIENARIIDVGAGTGKFSELLAKRDEKYEVLAVEPHGGMRKECVRKGLRGVKVVDGVANAMPVETQSADAVVVAQKNSTESWSLAELWA
ncbi:MAG: hypothetical protein Q9208_007313 [Pyrenodesmia sp. 3 TL-2023]